MAGVTIGRAEPVLKLITAIFKLRESVEHKSTKIKNAQTSASR